MKPRGGKAYFYAMGQRMYHDGMSYEYVRAWLRANKQLPDFARSSIARGFSHQYVTN